ncbi:MAG: hypothetical protein QOD51_1527 [Candidatus Eremiobacteraeota bacterium]|nr:hypothetical protein [Candidatus Eremiobacteraeota bacterium]
MPVLPASAADDDLVRQLVNACTGCRFPKDLHGRDLHGLHFTAADLRGVDFSRANLNGAVFVGADLVDARFDDADLRNARFTGVRFRNTSFARAKTDGVLMEGVRLDTGSIVGADYRLFVRGCTGCDLSEMKLSNVERKLRRISMNPPAIDADMERAMRAADAAMRAADTQMRAVERALRLHPPVIPPMPPMPPVPAMPAVPAAPPAP